MPLADYLGKEIGQICPLGYADPHDNHCAHFISHVLGFTFGYTCGMVKTGSGQAGSIRVQEVFARCQSVGKWDDKPAAVNQCLVFITAAGDVHLKTRQMDNVPKKHVGILANGLIWHYSNSRHQVVNQTPDQFKTHYPAPHNSMFYGQIPWVVSL
jgi:hypothetical protein